MRFFRPLCSLALLAAVTAGASPQPPADKESLTGNAA
jgi:hypothetical protein